MNQHQSRKALVGILVLGAVLLSAPLLWQAWTTSHELQGKSKAFAATTTRTPGAVLGCLIHRGAGGLKLDIVSQNHFSDPARGIAVRLEPGNAGTRVEAWITQGSALTTGETAQLQSCTAS